MPDKDASTGLFDATPAPDEIVPVPVKETVKTDGAARVQGGRTDGTHASIERSKDEKVARKLTVYEGDSQAVVNKVCDVTVVAFLNMETKMRAGGLIQ